AGGDALAARWEASRERLLEDASFRPFVRVPVTRAAEAEVAPAAAAATGRDFGRLVHQLLEWTPFDEWAPETVLRMAAAVAPIFGRDAAAARRGSEHAARALALPVIERARKASRVWRELPIAFTDEGRLIEGIVDLVFEEDGQLVIVDYKSDAITDDQA